MPVPTAWKSLGGGALPWDFLVSLADIEREIVCVNATKVCSRVRLLGSEGAS